MPKPSTVSTSHQDHQEGRARRRVPTVLAAALIVGGASLTGPLMAAYAEQPQMPVVELTDRPLDADFDGDGRDELVVGVPLEDVGGVVNAGGVAVISLRTSPLRNQFFTRATAGIDGDPTAGDQFGYAVATTDIDGDGFDDLAIGAPYEDVDGIADAGGVHILYGSVDGLVTEGSQHLTQNTDGIEDEAEAGDLMGWSLVAGQLGNLHDTLKDLAVGAPGEDVGEADDAGAVHAIYGSADGLTADGDEFFTQDSPASSTSPSPATTSATPSRSTMGATPP